MACRGGSTIFDRFGKGSGSAKTLYLTPEIALKRESGGGRRVTSFNVKTGSSYRSQRGIHISLKGWRGVLMKCQVLRCYSRSLKWL